jgi:hypothetical protein
VGVWGCGGVGVWGCGGRGWFPLAFEHSKVCTLCDFGHLQFIIPIIMRQNEIMKKSSTARNHAIHYQTKILVIL